MNRHSRMFLAGIQRFSDAGLPAEKHAKMMCEDQDKNHGRLVLKISAYSSCAPACKILRAASVRPPLACDRWPVLDL